MGNSRPFDTTWSRRIAAALRAAGVSAGDPVGVMVEQGAAQIAAIFGALRAGAIYVPLDAALPVVRLRTIIGDAGLRTIVADRMNRSLVRWLVPGGQVLDAGRAEAAASLRDPDLDPHTDVGPDAPACIYYTSGSTGPAKGVLHSHRNVMRPWRQRVQHAHAGALVRPRSPGLRPADERPGRRGAPAAVDRGGCGQPPAAPAQRTTTRALPVGRQLLRRLGRDRDGAPAACSRRTGGRAAADQLRPARGLRRSADAPAADRTATGQDRAAVAAGRETALD
jgi:AMP-binding enzyme